MDERVRKSAGERYRLEAEKWMGKYIRKQQDIEVVEESFLKAHQGNKLLASTQLKQDQKYNSMCGDRDSYMRQAQLFATFVLMYK